jgi:ribosomal RNA-processing protein 8
MLAASVANTVHSFDLLAVNDSVVACDIAHVRRGSLDSAYADTHQVPLAKSTLDVAIYSLSLMGTNYLDFLLEAYRVLKVK